MATGSGKTRTVIALVDLMMRCNYVKRVLFLADRISLVKQAAKEFGKNLPSASVVNLLDSTDSTGRVYVSTYPTMLNLINNTADTVRKFGIGFFDLVIVDEAHRSIYAKYGALFDYFDSYLVGLTATPKNEVDHNTYQMFQLERGVPTFAYGLDEAIAEKHLVPYKAISVPLKFQREGINYDDLSEEEKQQWDELDWGEDGAPDSVGAGAINQWLFNEDTVDKVLERVMTRGEKVASGDRLGKTIIFAKNNDHADFIEQRFNVNYPQYNGKFARVITYKTEYAQSLIDAFSVKDSDPHIAISVDMLDTGIDVPEVLNLVFFKQVHSKTKFWQMIGRGTRLCADLYAPGRDKKFFNIFDFCQNFEFFNQNPQIGEGSKAESLDTRLFKRRLDLITAIGETERPKPSEQAQQEEQELKIYTSDFLHDIVSNMTLENIIVRPQRQYVEKYSVKDIWKRLTTAEATEVAERLASLPSLRRDAEEEAKHFDYLILSAQLSVLETLVVDDKTKSLIQKLMMGLEEQASIPAIRAQMSLIQSLASDEWWLDVTVGMLEHVRRQLRLLIKLLERSKRTIIYTNFEDELGTETVVEPPNPTVGVDYDRFKARASEFLRQHKDHLALRRLRKNLPITATDLAELERIMLEQAKGDETLVVRLKVETEGLGLFVRSLVGLEPDAANEAMSKFLSDASATRTQIAFVRMIVQQLTHDGAMKRERLYEAPFTDIAATGPDSVFPSEKVTELLSAIDEIRSRAVA
jgi:type I restriction enzyme R subunit